LGVFILETAVSRIIGNGVLQDAPPGVLLLVFVPGFVAGTTIKSHL
jgi:hypothetical protein